MADSENATIFEDIDHYLATIYCEHISTALHRGAITDKNEKYIAKSRKQLKAHTNVRIRGACRLISSLFSHARSRTLTSGFQLWKKKVNYHRHMLIRTGIKKDMDLLSIKLHDTELQNREMQMISMLATRGLGYRDAEDKAFQEICQMIKVHISSAGVVIFVQENETSYVKHNSSESTLNVELSSIATKITNIGDLQVINNRDVLNFIFPEAKETEAQMYTLLCAPLRDESGSTLGIMCVLHDGAEKMSPCDKKCLRRAVPILSDIICNRKESILNAVTYEHCKSEIAALQHDIAKLNVYNKACEEVAPICKDLHMCDDLSVIESFVCGKLCNLVGGEYARIFLVSKDMKNISRFDPNSTSIPVTPIIAKCLSTKTLINENDPSIGSLYGDQYNSVLCFPIKAKNERVVAIIEIVRASRSPFSPVECMHVRTIANAIGISIPRCQSVAKILATNASLQERSKSFEVKLAQQMDQIMQKESKIHLDGKLKIFLKEILKICSVVDLHTIISVQLPHLFSCQYARLYLHRGREHKDAYLYDHMSATHVFDDDTADKSAANKKIIKKNARGSNQFHEICIPVLGTKSDVSAVVQMAFSRKISKSFEEPNKCLLDQVVSVVRECIDHCNAFDEWKHREANLHYQCHLLQECHSLMQGIFASGKASQCIRNCTLQMCEVFSLSKVAIYIDNDFREPDNSKGIKDIFSGEYQLFGIKSNLGKNLSSNTECKCLAEDAGLVWKVFCSGKGVVTSEPKKNPRFDPNYDLVDDSGPLYTYPIQYVGKSHKTIGVIQIVAADADILDGNFRKNSVDSLDMTVPIISQALANRLQYLCSNAKIVAEVNSNDAITSDVVVRDWCNGKFGCGLLFEEINEFYSQHSIHGKEKIAGFLLSARKDISELNDHMRRTFGVLDARLVLLAPNRDNIWTTSRNGKRTIVKAALNEGIENAGIIHSLLQHDIQQNLEPEIYHFEAGNSSALKSIDLMGILHDPTSMICFPVYRISEDGSSPIGVLQVIYNENTDTREPFGTRDLNLIKVYSLLLGQSLAPQPAARDSGQSNEDEDMYEAMGISNQRLLQILNDSSLINDELKLSRQILQGALHLEDASFAALVHADLQNNIMKVLTRNSGGYMTASLGQSMLHQVASSGGSMCSDNLLDIDAKQGIDIAGDSFRDQIFRSVVMCAIQTSSKKDPVVIICYYFTGKRPLASLSRLLFALKCYSLQVNTVLRIGRRLHATKEEHKKVADEFMKIEVQMSSMARQNTESSKRVLELERILLKFTAEKSALVAQISNLQNSFVSNQIANDATAATDVQLESQDTAEGIL